MSPRTIRRVQSLTEKQLDDLVAVCMRAYEHEPATQAMVGGNDALRPLLFRAMIQAGVHDSEGYLYVLEIDENVASATLWFSPGHGLWQTEESRKLGLNQLMDALDEYTRDWWKNTLTARMEEFWKESTSIPREKMWYTNLLVTDPSYQRRGYASSLMKHVLSNVVELSASSPSFAGLGTTSKENELFYNRLGYPTKGFTTIPNRFRPFPVWIHLMELNE